MDNTLLVAGGVVTLFVFVIIISILSYLFKVYNILVNLRMNADRQSSHVEVHLKKKFDMIPAVVECVKGYAKHEKGVLEEVTRLRSQWGASKNPDEKIKNAGMLEAALSKLLVVQEQYPQLKADKSFIMLQDNINRVENELVHERKVYNKRVSYYNVKVQEFPSMLVAKLFGFKEKPFFSIENDPRGTTSHDTESESLG
jgi:LemA protein